MPQGDLSKQIFAVQVQQLCYTIVSQELFFQSRWGVCLVWDGKKLFGQTTFAAQALLLPLYVNVKMCPFKTTYNNPVPSCLTPQLNSAPQSLTVLTEYAHWSRRRQIVMLATFYGPKSAWSNMHLATSIWSFRSAKLWCDDSGHFWAYFSWKEILCSHQNRLYMCEEIKPYAGFSVWTEMKNKFCNSIYHVYCRP